MRKEMQRRKDDAGEQVGLADLPETPRIKALIQTVLNQSTENNLFQHRINQGKQQE